MTFEELHKLFVNSGKTIGVAESFTGGRFAAGVTANPGASKYFKGSLVTYATEEKHNVLGISNDRIATYGVVSQEIAGDMAMQARSILQCDFTISFTGNAGPSAMENKPVGEVYVACAGGNLVQVFKYNLQGTREQIVIQAMDVGCQLLAMLLERFK